MAKALAEKWKDDVVVKLFLFAKVCLEKLNNEGYSNISPGEIDTAINLMGAKTPEDLIKLFLSQHQYWDRAIKKDITFILEDMPKLFQVINVKPVIEPIRVYHNREKLIEDRVKAGKKVDLTTFPIPDDDYQSYWNLITSVIKGAYAYNLKFMGSEAYDLSRFKELLETKRA